MPRSKKKFEVPEAELNLAPIMALLVVLIPILLYAFNFFEVKIQAVQAPRMGSGKPQPKDKDKKPLNLTVLITKEGFAVKKQSELTDEPEPKIFKRQFEGVDGEEYDYPALYTRLMQVKKQYPNEKTVNIGAEMSIPWRVIARTIDAARLQLEGDEYSTLAEYSKAKPKMVTDSKGHKEAQELFPAVVFVVAE